MEQLDTRFVSNEIARIMLHFLTINFERNGIHDEITKKLGVGPHTQRNVYQKKKRRPEK